MQDGLRQNFQIFSTKSGFSGRFYHQTKFSQHFCREFGSGLSPCQRFSPISHESFEVIKRVSIIKKYVAGETDETGGLCMATVADWECQVEYRRMIHRTDKR